MRWTRCWKRRSKRRGADSTRRSNMQDLRVIKEINPILRGWVNYFAVGHSTRCFSYIKQWVEKKIRRHLMRARGRKGFGWKRWSTKWLYDKLGIFNGYRVSWQRA